MSYFEVILLGLVQGIAEFLPISSSGHLVILESLMGGHAENLELNVALHFGSLLSILVVYRNDILPVLKQPKLMLAIIVETLPIVVSGLLLKGLFETASTLPIAAGIGLCVTSLLLFITPRIDNGTRTLPEIRIRDAFVIGLFQAVAPWPGVSRSGSTIVAALMMGVHRESAANFSFYIAVPALLGATVLTGKDLLSEGYQASTPLAAIVAGTVVSFVVGILALKSLIRLISARKLNWFAWYVLGVAWLTIVGSIMGWFGNNGA